MAGSAPSSGLVALRSGTLAVLEAGWLMPLVDGFVNGFDTGEHLDLVPSAHVLAVVLQLSSFSSGTRHTRMCRYMQGQATEG